MFDFISFFDNVTNSISAYFYALSQMTLLEIMWTFFKDWAWIFLVYLFLLGLRQAYLNFIQSRYLSKQRYVLLAIDVPKDVKQSPKAVENFVTALSGGHWAYSWREKWLEGVVQLAFSLEIVSIDGHIQFLIRTPVQYRALVEAALHTQYPDAEITEVEDYVNDFPDKFPDEKYNWKGGEFGPVKSDGIPIRTYPEFYDEIDGEFKDPLAILLENMAKLEKGEQIWYQLVVKPTGFDWVKKCDEAKEKVLKGRPFMDLTDVEKELVRKIEAKKHKMGFVCKLRVLYLGERQVFKGWRLAGIVSVIKQFNSNIANSLRPYWGKYGTSTDYFFEWRRKRKLAWKQNYVMSLYKRRDGSFGYPPYVFNSEEIATLWHFPSVEIINTALLKKTDSKKSEAPVNLPIAPENDVELKEKVEAAEIVTWDNVKEFTFDMDNDYFEKRYAKDKSKFLDKEESETNEVDQANKEENKEDDSNVEKTNIQLEKEENVSKEKENNNLAENNSGDKVKKEDNNNGELKDKVEPPSNLPI